MTTTPSVSRDLGFMLSHTNMTMLDGTRGTAHAIAVDVHPTCCH